MDNFECPNLTGAKKWGILTFRNFTKSPKLTGGPVQSGGIGIFDGFLSIRYIVIWYRLRAKTSKCKVDFLTIQVLTRYILELNFHKKLEWRACLVLKKNVDILRNKGLRCHFTIIYTGSLMFSYIIKLKGNTYFYLK